MIPVVLSGGYRTRMGEDKGLKKWNGRPIALSVLELIHKSFEQDAVMVIRLSATRLQESTPKFSICMR
ncbi:MAG: NTP transferase domain-containing protein [Saprospiraceae bacterium]